MSKTKKTCYVPRPRIPQVKFLYRAGVQVHAVLLAWQRVDPSRLRRLLRRAFLRQVDRGMTRRRGIPKAMRALQWSIGRGRCYFRWRMTEIKLILTTLEVFAFRKNLFNPEKDCSFIWNYPPFSGVSWSLGLYDILPTMTWIKLESRKNYAQTAVCTETRRHQQQLWFWQYKITVQCTCCLRIR